MAKKKKTFKSGMSQEFVDEEGTLHRQYVVHEQVDGYVDVKLPKRAKFNNGGFITLFQKTMFNIATNADLSKGEMKLLLYLLGTAGIDNSVCTDLNIVCKDMNIDKGNLSRDLNRLVNRKIVIKNKGHRGQGVQFVPIELSINYDQLNYDLAYNGKIKEYKSKQGNHPEIDTSPIKEIEARRNPGLFHQIDLEDSIREIKAERAAREQNGEIEF